MPARIWNSKEDLLVMKEVAETSMFSVMSVKG
jgi:hypothetical protein